MEKFRATLFWEKLSLTEQSSIQVKPSEKKHFPIVNHFEIRTEENSNLKKNCQNNNIKIAFDLTGSKRKSYVRLREFSSLCHQSSSAIQWNSIRVSWAQQPQAEHCGAKLKQLLALQDGHFGDKEVDSQKSAWGWQSGNLVPSTNINCEKWFYNRSSSKVNDAHSCS